MRQSEAMRAALRRFDLSMKWTLSCLVWFCVSVAAQLPAATTFSTVPAATTNRVGESIQLALRETGDLTTVFGFQWSKDGTPLSDGDRINGTTSPVLFINNAQFEDSGSYSLSFSASAATDVVSMTVTSQVYVVDVPAIQNLYLETPGAGVRFTVIATGGLLSYQWTWQGEDIPGATNSVLSYADAYSMANAGLYAVHISNPVDPEGITSPPQALQLTKPTPKGTYQGLFFEDGEVTTASCGFFQYNLSASARSFSGKLIMGANTYRFSSSFSTTHESSVVVPRSGSTPLTLQLQLLTLNSTPQVTGTVSDGVWTVPLLGNRLYFSSSNPTPLAGKYTLALLNTNLSTDMPNGNGFGAVVIQKNGQLMFKGKAADGSSVSQAIGLSRFGDWPLYLRANQNRGRLIGWLAVNKQTASSITGGNVDWVKDPGADALYPQGFSLVLRPAGSTYVPPSPTKPLLSWTNGVAGFSGGDLSDPTSSTQDSVKVSLKAPATIHAEPGTEGLRLAVNRGNGFLSGSFFNIGSGERNPIQGVVLQQQKSAQGYFLGTDVAGAFSLLPVTSN